MGNFRILIAFIILPLVILSCASDSKTLKISQRSIDFGPVYIADTKAEIITLTNKYGKDLSITSIALSGSPDFVIIQGGSVPILLANNQTHDIEVQFAPTTPGVLDALISIKFDLSEKARDVELKGEGIPVPRIDLSDKSYDFGTVYVSASDTHDFIVTNIGTDVLNVSNIALIGTSANLYSITAGNAPFTVAAGTSHTFTLEFSPLADGTFPVSLEISHDAVNESSPLSIPIDAAAVTFAPEIKFNETSSWDIGQHSTAIITDVDLIITSDGVDPLTITSASFVTGTEFTVAEFQDKNANVVNLPQTIQPGDTLTIKIEFAPSANQKYNDTLTITHDAINESSPYDFIIEGEGRVPTDKTFVYTGAIENWTVPAGVTKITIEAWGAQGARSGGKGAYIKGDVAVTPGETLKILVGQQGFDGYSGVTYLGGGGGGGSFVCKSNNDPLVIAGGGGGKTSTGAYTTMDGRHTTDGGDTYNNGGGNNGQGGLDGQVNAPAAGGGGLLTNGGDVNTRSCVGGKAFVNGGTGGVGTGTGTGGGNGGFGGGGGGYTNAYNRGGGGGGYSGGQGGTWSGQYSGGGGGSINNGTSQTNQSGIKTGNGEIKIAW